MKLSIIIPVFNEEKTIQEVIKRIADVSLHVEKEIIIVDDCSTDKTLDILTSLKGKIDFKLLEHKINQGKGVAIKTGLGAVSGDFILIQDADLEYDPKDYPALIEPFLVGDTDIVYGSRNMIKNPRSSNLYFWGGRLISFFFNFLYGANVSDINTGYKVFKKGILESLDLKEKRFSFCEEVTCKALRKGYKIKEVPIHYYPRSFQDGKKIRWWREGPKSILAMLKYRNYK
ncbi:MAG: glycosyltransferase family 2 protein [Candidatus Staskawiczbacteria bacterium]|nr:glycosyltransferase family 2 protein [Candidatus Staskawiczbacteria bacterium]